MAKRTKGEESKVEPAAAEPAADAATDLDWDIRMTEVQRIEPDPEDDEPDDLFSVSFSVDGPNSNAQIEITVVDAADIEVVAIALDTLHGALLAWADLIRPGKRRCGPSWRRGETGRLRKSCFVALTSSLTRLKFNQSILGCSFKPPCGDAPAPRTR